MTRYRTFSSDARIRTETRPRTRTGLIVLQDCGIETSIQAGPFPQWIQRGNGTRTLTRMSKHQSHSSCHENPTRENHRKLIVWNSNFLLYLQQEQSSKVGAGHGAPPARQGKFNIHLSIKPERHDLYVCTPRTAKLLIQKNK